MFQVWKTIKLGTGLRSADNFCKAIKSARMRIDGWADDILGKKEFGWPSKRKLNWLLPLSPTLASRTVHLAGTSILVRKGWDLTIAHLKSVRNCVCSTWTNQEVNGFTLLWTPSLTRLTVFACLSSGPMMTHIGSALTEATQTIFFLVATVSFSFVVSIATPKQIPTFCS